MRQIEVLAGVFASIGCGAGAVLRRLVTFALLALSYAHDIGFASALTAISVGLWWERPSLALIVPGTVVGVLALAGRLRALREN